MGDDKFDQGLTESHLKDRIEELQKALGLAIGNWQHYANEYRENNMDEKEKTVYLGQGNGPEDKQYKDLYFKCYGYYPS